MAQPAVQPSPKTTTDTDKKGFWQKTTLFQKIGIFVILILFGLLLWNTISGGIHSFYELIFVVIATGILAGFLYIIVITINNLFAPKYYSPKEDFFTRTVNEAMDYKLPNVGDLYFQGDKEHRAIFAGRIVGTLGLPYYVGTPSLDKNGNWEYMESKLLNMKVPKFNNIELSKDGDTLFIYEKGFWIFKKKHFLRCNRELHGDLSGDVVIYDINPVPYGKFWEYPYKQLQRDTGRIMIQSQLEVIISTAEHQGDLISQSADLGLYANPNYKMVKESNAEVQRE